MDRGTELTAAAGERKERFVGGSLATVKRCTPWRATAIDPLSRARERQSDTAARPAMDLLSSLSLAILPP